MRDLIMLVFQILIILLLVINFKKLSWTKKSQENIGKKQREIEIQNALTTILCKYQMIATGTQDFQVKTEYKQKTAFGYYTTEGAFNNWNFKTITAIAQYEDECKEIEKMVKKELANTTLEIKSIERSVTSKPLSLNRYKITIELKKL